MCMYMMTKWLRTLLTISTHSLPHAKITNPDISRIINSDEVQAVLRPEREFVHRSVKVKTNPLKNRKALFHLNPYAKVQRKSRGPRVLLISIRLRHYLVFDSRAGSSRPSCREEKEGQETKGCWREVLVHPLCAMSTFLAILYSYISSCHPICHMLPYPMHHGWKQLRGSKLALRKCAPTQNAYNAAKKDLLIHTGNERQQIGVWQRPISGPGKWAVLGLVSYDDAA